jgi:hypothetical protein
MSIILTQSGSVGEATKQYNQFKCSSAQDLSFLPRRAAGPPCVAAAAPRKRVFFYFIFNVPTGCCLSAAELWGLLLLFFLYQSVYRISYIALFLLFTLLYPPLEWSYCIAITKLLTAVMQIFNIDWRSMYFANLPQNKHSKQKCNGVYLNTSNS